MCTLCGVLTQFSQLEFFIPCSVNNPVMYRVALGWAIQQTAGVRCTRRSRLFHGVSPTHAVNCQFYRHNMQARSRYLNDSHLLSTNVLPLLVYLAVPCPHKSCLMNTLNLIESTSRNIRAYLVAFFAIGPLLEWWLIIFKEDCKVCKLRNLLRFYTARCVCILALAVSGELMEQQQINSFIICGNCVICAYQRVLEQLFLSHYVREPILPSI